MATPEQRAVWGVRQRFLYATVRRPVPLSCGPPLSWARLPAGGVGVCELPTRRRRDEAPKAVEARVASFVQAPRRNSLQAAPRGVRTHACAAHSRLRVPPGFDTEISSSFSSAYPSLLFSSSRPGHEHCLFNSHLPVSSLFPPRKPLRADLCRCGYGFGDLGRGAPFAAVFLDLSSMVSGNLPAFDKQYSWVREATSHVQAWMHEQ
ncbi:uncharacterized protein LOC120658106 isoform X2 [Panicum virgatum]|uniref:uncharacterized protein LOC120658106 isoform X2 n=1 Tax=Panicum virgatum TaxID=38727 RepID=UPI0019D65452|nr:uncharacterized protein LOC120658106 isoform X2 [Panicum virgatum]